MSQNKKWILLCTVALFAVMGFLAVRGIGADSADGEPGVTEAWSAGSQTEQAVTEAAAEAAEPQGTKAPTNVSESKTKSEDTKEQKNGKKETVASQDSVQQTEGESSGDKNSSDKKLSEKKSSGKEKTKKKTTKSEGKENDTSAAKPKKAETKEPGYSAWPASQTETPARTEEQQSECTLTVTCQQVFSHRDKLSESAKKVIPENGVILEGSYGIEQGDTVFDVLKRACSQKNIMLDYIYTPLYSTYYIRGISNLYEFDCGDESGWMYSVNGSTPGYGCSQYKLSEGDRVIFYYTCER